MEQNTMSKRKSHINTIKFLIIYSLLFIVVCFFGFIPFWKNGKTFIWNFDGVLQYYPSLLYISRYIKEFLLNLLNGNFQIKMFDFSIGYGEDILSTLNHYGFGDPLSILTVFFSSKNMEYAYNFLIILRLYLAGIAFYIFCNYFKMNSRNILIGTMVYLFSGFATKLGITFPNFINCMIYIPLMTLGMEKIIRYEKPYLFIGSYIISAFNGFYFLYMETVFLVVYVLVRLTSIKSINFKKKIITIGRCIYFYISAALVSSLVLAPCIVGFLNSSRTDFVGGSNRLFLDLSDIIRNTYGMFNPYRAVTCISALSIVFISILVIYSIKDKLKSLKLGVALCIILYMFNFTGIVMNGFSTYTERFIFLISFVFAVATVFAYDYFYQLNKKSKVVICCLSFSYIMFSITIGVLKHSLIQAFISSLSLLLILIICCIIGARFRNSKFIYWCIVLIVGLNAIGNMNGLYSNKLYGYGNEFQKISDTYNIYLGHNEEFIDDCYNYEYGTSLLYDNKMTNASLCLDYKGNDRYFSISNKNTYDFLCNIYNSNVNSVSNIEGLDNRTILSTLLGNKYYIVDNNNLNMLPYGYKKVKHNDLELYENEFVLPFGYSYSNVINKDSFDIQNGINKQEILLSSAVIEDDIEGLSVGEQNNYNRNLDYKITNLKDVSIKDNNLIVEKENGLIEIEFIANKNEETYIEFNNFNVTQSEEGINYIGMDIMTDKIKSNYLFVSPKINYYLYRDKFLVNLGHSHDGTVKVQIVIDNPCQFSFDNINIYSENFEQYSELVNRLKEDSLENVKFDNNKVTGNIDLSEDKLLCVRIPYSNGWSAIVDGKPAEIIKTNGMFSGIMLNKGYHTIEFKYCSPGLKLGALLTGLGVINLIVYVFMSKKMSLKQ